MKAGAERKKVVLLAALIVVAAGSWYYQFGDSPSAAAPPRPASAPAAQARQMRSAADEILDNRPVPKPRSASNEFKPSLKIGKPGEGPDPDKVDPTLRTDLLAKVQAVEYQGAERNLFQFGAAKPKLTPQQIEKAKVEAAKAAEELKAAQNAKPAEPPKPVAPPVTMKYFGYANRPGEARRRAFLMDGDDILVTYEGDVIKRRYRVVRIGINSLVVEDLQFHSEQTLPLQESS